MPLRRAAVPRVPQLTRCSAAGTSTIPAKETQVPQLYTPVSRVPLRQLRARLPGHGGLGDEFTANVIHNQHIPTDLNVAKAPAQFKNK